MGGGPEYKGGLNNTMASVGSLIDLTIIPWGNARLSGGVWECQHGPGECMGNTIESCVMHLYPGQDKFWPFVNKYEQMAHTCSRTKPGTCPVDIALKIASGMGMDSSKISQCFGNFDSHGMPPKSSLGFTLQTAAMQRTAALSPAHNGVPYTTNGPGNTAPRVPDASMKEPMFTCWVCNAYKGNDPKPPACAKCAAPKPPPDCFDDYTTKTTCDANSGCTWCLSGAVPAACNTLADAKGLPPGVFTCDKKAAH